MSIRLRGQFGERLDRCVANRIMVQDVEMLVAPFRTRAEKAWWQTEFWGKWMLSAVGAARYRENGALRKKMDDAVTGLLATQSGDGYIGNYAPAHRLQQWDIWGRKYTLLGLLAYAGLTGREEALAAAVRVADHLRGELDATGKDIVRTGNYRGMPSCSVLQPLCRLHRATGEQRFLDFALDIVRRWEAPDALQLIRLALEDVPVAERHAGSAKWWGWENGRKAYEMMSCYEGLLELHELTGEADFLAASAKAARNILATEINIAGGGSAYECWYDGRRLQSWPTRHGMETCVTTTWMALCERLLRLTDDTVFADAIEVSAYNALLGAMLPDGSLFAKYSDLNGVRRLGEDQCAMPINCCIANGPRGLLLFAAASIAAHGSGLTVNFFGDTEADLTLAGGLRMSLKISGGYPRQGAVTLTLRPARTAIFPLRLRIPAWSAATEIRVNAEKSAAVQPGRYHVIERAWAPGDTVQMSLDLRAKVVWDDERRHFAVVRGPLALAQDNRDGGHLLNVPLRPASAECECAPAGEAYSVDFVVGTDEECGRGKPQSLILRDYASAGDAWDSKNTYRTWICRAHSALGTDSVG